MTEAEFRARLQADGYDEPEILERAPNLTNEDHTHDFSAAALVLEGELNVVTADGTTTCGPGDTFELTGGTLHHERYGPDGARYLLGRRPL